MTTQCKEQGRVLIENWVEERACEALDSDIPSPVVNRSGHEGIITTNKPDSEDLSTTVRETFRPPSANKIRQKGMLKYRICHFLDSP